MSDHVWETFDDLFKTVYRQGRMIEALEARLGQLERLLRERAAVAELESFEQAEALNTMPVERAA